MKHISTHIKRAMVTVRQTERGELMQYFCKELNRARERDGLAPISMGRMGKLLQQVPTKDLYYLKKVCDDAGNFSKKFWYLLNPEKYEKGQPVLIGTVSIEKSEVLSSLLARMDVPHQVLNAKHHEREAEIVADAGQKGTITIATNMAGRGTDT